MPKYRITFDVDMCCTDDLEADSAQEAMDDIRRDWGEYVNTVTMSAREIKEDGKSGEYFEDTNKRGCP